MLRGIWLRFVLVIATVAIALPTTVLLLLFPRWKGLFTGGGKLWSRIMLAAAGARVQIHDLPQAYRHDPCMFIANHGSMVDIWVMFTFMPASARFVAKQELFKIPVFGWVLRASGCVAIDRGRRQEAIRSLQSAGEQIRAGRSVVLYPEGTRSKDGRLGPFKKGAFHLAVKAGVPVVPVSIRGSFEMLPPGSWRVNPGVIDVQLDAPIDVAPYQPSNPNGLLNHVRSIIEQRLASPAERK